MICKHVCVCRQLLQLAFTAWESRAVFPTSSQTQPQLSVGLDSDGSWIHGAEADVGSHTGLQTGHRSVRYTVVHYHCCTIVFIYV